MKIRTVIYFILLIILVSSCMHNNQPVRLASEPADYVRLGLNENQYEPWEDGLRTNPDEPSFEWWYFDAHFTDGSSLVVVYYTKSIFHITRPTEPKISITYTTPDGKKIERKQTYTKEESYFQKEECAVLIGENYCKGDLNTYDIFANIDDIEIDLTLRATVPTWRIGTGHIFFGKDELDYFAWLPAVPDGLIEGSVTFNGTKNRVVGTGYHDHNWGNIPISWIERYWWWTRAQIGEYTIIAAYQRFKKKYGKDANVNFLVVLDENGVVSQPDLNTTSHFNTADIYEHPDRLHKEPIAKTIKFQNKHKNGDYARLVCSASKLLESNNLLDQLGIKGFKRKIADLLGKTPWYTRFYSEARLELSINGRVKTTSGIATVELMDLE